MRIVVAVLASLFLLAACGNEAEIAAKKEALNDVKAQLKALDLELADKQKEWQPVEDAFIEASQALRRAMLGGDAGERDTAQAAYTETKAENQRVNDLKSKLLRRKTALKKKKKKILRDILALGGGNLEPDSE